VLIRAADPIDVGPQAARTAGPRKTRIETASMAMTVYKSGQGYWTRLMTAIGIGTLTLGAAAWFNAKILEVYVLSDASNALYWKAGIFAGTALIVGALLWHFLNKPKIADFMIATENEMKKVNWPSKQSVIALTWIVIAGTMMIALILFLANTAFTYLFQWLDVLQT
jgi:preprotein translocase SecE subunit